MVLPLPMIKMMLSLLIVQSLLATGQSPSPAFEVASVKRSATKRFVPPTVNPQSFHTVMSLADAIEWAYDIEAYQLAGGPVWLHRDYFEIEVKTRMPVTKKEMRVVLQSVLAGRFKLKFHREARQLSVYALVVAVAGPRLTTAKGPCGEDGCINVAPGIMVSSYAMLPSIAATLSNMIDRPVLDQTGLQGRYDFRLKFDPSFQTRYDGQPTGNAPTGDPSIFVAIQDLGLKLDPRRAPVEMLVIDGAEIPDAN
jgi:bla regulator protein blaR1